MKEPIFFLDKVSFNYKSTLSNRPILDHIDLKIFSNESIAIIGPSGAGKTCLAKLISGFLKKGSGVMNYQGKPHPGVPNPEIQLVFQNPYESLTPHLRVFNILKDPFSPKVFKQISPLFELLLKELNLEERHLEAFPYQLSGGEAQRIALMRALLQRPKILICDEILSSVDSLLQKSIILFLKSLQKKEMFSIVWITHEYLTARFLEGQIFTLFGGSLYANGSGFTGDVKVDSYIQELNQAIEWILEYET